MPRNKLIDLHNHLFEQLERLNNDGLNPGELQSEIRRSEAMAKLGTAIIDNAALALNLAKHVANEGVIGLPGWIQDNTTLEK